MHAETVEAAAWWARPRGPAHATWITNYQQSLGSRQRTVIVDIMRSLKAKTLLEIGCHCGPNLVRLARELPDLQMIGLDVNVEAIQAGRAWVASLGLAHRIQLNAGRCPDLTQRIADLSVDVVLSCYACAYVAPADLNAMLYELGRLAARAIILAEPMAPQAKLRGALTGYREWAHDYRDASRWINTWSGMTLQMVPIDPPVDRLATILVAARASDA